MTYQELFSIIKKKRSFLCIGLDTDIRKIPKHLSERKDVVFAFNKAIIDATHHLAVAYKINTAFYESQGLQGWESLQKTIQYLNENIKDVFTIADAKRGDIGNTSEQYAKAFLSKEVLDFDAITVVPYMGRDSVKPFLKFKDKWVILLALTSNQGAEDFQLLTINNKEQLYKEVIHQSKNWASKEEMMYVVGATKAEMLLDIRNIIPHHFLLVPGVGAQGGSFDDIVKYGMNKNCGLLINSSRGIIFASSGEDFAQKAFLQAGELQKKMEIALQQNNLI